MRQFGQTNLANANTLELHQQRHADYYADYVLSRRSQLQGSRDMAAAAAVEHELDNIRIALRRAADDHLSSRFEIVQLDAHDLDAQWTPSEGASWAV